MIESLLDKIKALPKPCQDFYEWQAYLEFIDAYFKNRGIEEPAIVEIGVFTNKQKMFYEKLLRCYHVGIDIDPKTKADIIGDSKDPATLARLKAMLGGRDVNLLFIDGGHSYESVKRDYEIYAPLAKNIIVLHDILFYNKSVTRFWNELVEGNRGKRNKTFITIGTWHNNPRKGLPPNTDWRMGTGLILIEEEGK